LAGALIASSTKAKVPTVKSGPELRDVMKSSTKDKVEGTFHEARGTAKEMAGRMTDNPKLEVKGKVEKIAGAMQEKIGKVKDVLGK